MSRFLALLSLCGVVFLAVYVAMNYLRRRLRWETDIRDIGAVVMRSQGIPAPDRTSHPSIPDATGDAGYLRAIGPDDTTAVDPDDAQAVRDAFQACEICSGREVYRCRLCWKVLHEHSHENDFYCAEHGLVNPVRERDHAIIGGGGAPGVVRVIGSVPRMVQS